MYTNHDLRTNIQEWKNRLYKATYSQFGNQMRFLFKNIDSNTKLKALMSEATSKYPFNEEEMKDFIDSIYDGYNLQFENEVDCAAFNYQLIKHLAEETGDYDFQNKTMFQSGNNFDDQKSNIIENHISPITNYLHDRLDEHNSVLYILEKYKKKVEWFTRVSLVDEYENLSKGYEQLLEDDLRLFLFEQGIDYPFSTPKSPSGRADVVGNIDSENSLIVEIKIFDKNKSYGKQRVIDGMRQILEYTNDYNKDSGYLVVFNFDEVEIDFSFSNHIKFPPSINISGKTLYFILINMYEVKSASTKGKASKVEITEEELIQSLKN